MRKSVFSPEVGEATSCPIQEACIGQFKLTLIYLNGQPGEKELPVKPWMADSAQILTGCKVAQLHWQQESLLQWLPPAGSWFWGSDKIYISLHQLASSCFQTCCFSLALFCQSMLTSVMCSNFSLSMSRKNAIALFPNSLNQGFFLFANWTGYKVGFTAHLGEWWIQYLMH